MTRPNTLGTLCAERNINEFFSRRLADDVQNYPLLLGLRLIDLAQRSLCSFANKVNPHFLC